MEPPSRVEPQLGPGDVLVIDLDSAGASTVALDVAASPHVTVSGQVQRAGLVHFEPGLSLVGAIIACGGFTSAAARRRVIVRRAGPTGARRRYQLSVTAIMQNEAPDFSLLAGDVVYVSESGV